ncbi:MAG: chromosome segregation ATPase, partial [Halothece sp.]
FARYGDIPSLQEGISQANRIQPNRALYNEAQQKINQWSSQIQQQQDQPLLDQAQALANGGNYRAAIQTARQVSSGRALYSQAQSKIQTWQREMVGQQRLQKAYELAELRTPDALVSAINIARQVPSGTQVKGESNTNVNRWSYELLTLAQDRANRDLREAINLAQKVPQGTEAYRAAQRQIESWEMILQPPPPVVTPNVPPPQSPTVTEIEVPEF